MAFFLEFLVRDGGCDGGCIDVAGSVGSVVVAAVLVVVSVVDAFVAGSVVLWIVFFHFLVTWVHPSFGLFRWSQGSKAGLVVGLVVFPGLLLSMLLLLLMLLLLILDFEGQFLISDLVCRTSRVASCPP